MIVCGIDPGLQGGAVVIEVKENRPRPTLLLVHDMPLTPRGTVDAPELQRILTQRQAELVVLELVSAAPGAGVASSFGFGHSAGIAEGVAHCCAPRIALVAPAQWKAAYRLPGGAAGKTQSVSMCAALVGRCMSEGCAEALLLAWYGARHRC